MCDVAVQLLKWMCDVRTYVRGRTTEIARGRLKCKSIESPNDAIKSSNSILQSFFSLPLSSLTHLLVLAHAGNLFPAWFYSIWKRKFHFKWNSNLFTNHKCTMSLKKSFHFDGNFSNVIKCVRFYFPVIPYFNTRKVCQLFIKRNNNSTMKYIQLNYDYYV